MLDYYRILGVTPQATEKDIKSAYRKLAKKYHPDVVKDDPDGNKKMYEIQEAYGVLGDEEKRKQYDSILEAGRERSRTGSGTGDPAPDMSRFERFFGFQPGKGMETYRGTGAGSGKSTGPVDPDDLFASFFGVKKR
ncbi:DnaJ domain-containing protein [Clostridium sp. Marseille-P2415]|uniref:DnaJ domain-containing protein n=1 Tax=Clostridium sp. Marseille-P2415 TaxID=1805471 RepID=UPI0009884250|nr:DnaJ domain-containing protein [Clostridium sp. Marseille-P2415]